MKVLVTGAAGFIGSKVTSRLLERGDQVVGVDNLNDYYDPELKRARLARFCENGNYTDLRADIADREAIAELFSLHKPQRVIHLAAQAGVRYSITNPHAYVDSNFVGFANILEGCRQNHVGHLVYASSSSVYGANTALPFSTDQNVDHPLSLYAASKKANELMAHTYSGLFKLPTTGLRFFTVYGPWGRPDMALFLFTKNILAGKPIDVFNFGKHTRGFTYIDDIAEGVIRVLDHVAAPNPSWSGAAADPGTSFAPYRIYNIGSDVATPLMRYIELIEQALGKKAELNLLPLQPGDVPDTCADVQDLMRDVGYQPRTPVEQGVRSFVSWYQVVLQGLILAGTPASESTLLMLLAKARQYWRGFASGSVNRRIFYAMTVIVAASFGVKLAMIVKDSVIAGSLGLGDALDAFLIALVIPVFAEMVLAQSFAAAFMPAYIRVQEHDGPQAAKRLFAHAMALNFVILVAATALLAIAGQPLLRLIASQFAEEKLAVAYEAYLILLPMVVIFGQLSLWGAVLNAGEKFALVALSPILTPLVIIAAVMTSGRDDVDVALLAWATVAGCAAELAAVGFALWRRGLLSIPKWQRAGRSHRNVLGQYLPLVLSAMIMGSSGVIDQAMASWLGAGNVAALNYGQKIPGILTGIGLTAMGTAVLPHFSRFVAVGDYAGLWHTLRTYARWIVILSIPLTAAFIAASAWIVAIIFERGAFKAEDTALVALIQQMYLLQVPFFVLGILGVRALVAMSKNHLLTIMSIVNLVVNVLGNLVFMRWLGVSGIALSTSVVYVISMTMIWVLVYHNLKRLRMAPEA